MEIRSLDTRSIERSGLTSSGLRNSTLRNYLTITLLLSITLFMSGCTINILEPGASTPEAASAETGMVAVDNLIVKGDQQRRNGELDAASATLGRALRLAPRAPEVYVALARVKLDAGQYGSAKQFAQKALSLFPSQSTWKTDRARSEAQWVLKEATQRQ